MKLYIVEHVYYKQKFLVRADNEAEAKIKASREVEKIKGVREKITDFEVYKLPALPIASDVAWL